MPDRRKRQSDELERDEKRMYRERTSCRSNYSEEVLLPRRWFENTAHKERSGNWVQSIRNLLYGEDFVKEILRLWGSVRTKERRAPDQDRMKEEERTPFTMTPKDTRAPRR
uniref:Uncharacterized protein n=1 Tax=Steinernema glaseri TaxID=37863 RepID=A0A1I7YLS5_9BILA